MAPSLAAVSHQPDAYTLRGSENHRRDEVEVQANADGGGCMQQLLALLAGAQFRIKIPAEGDD